MSLLLKIGQIAINFGIIGLLTIVPLYFLISRLVVDKSLKEPLSLIEILLLLAMQLPWLIMDPILVPEFIQKL